MPGASTADPSLVTRVGNAVCHHLDGTAIGAVAAELLDRGVFEKLKKARVALNVNRLADEMGARTGYFHVAMRLLAHQGFVHLDGDMSAGETSAILTDHGMEWLGLIDYYRQAPLVLDRAALLLEVLNAGKGDNLHEWGLPDIPAGREGAALHKRVALHLHGWLVAVTMKELSSRGILNEMGSGIAASVALQDHGLEPRIFEFLGDILRSQGWAQRDTENLLLTDAGRTAACVATQYYYPVSYLPTLRIIPQLLFGTESASCPSAAESDEHHIDRLLDVRFSGLVFEHRCKESFLDMVLPLFDREPVSEQPECIVDTGSGDGTLLVALYEAVRDRTLRGRMLSAHPLMLVGAEFSRIAKDATEQAFQDLGVPYLAIFGDIGDPSGLSRKLAEHGIDPFNVLHVNKSVIHNRRYKPPGMTHRRDSWQPLSQAPFVSEDGILIAARDLECNLLELFEDWIPFTRKNGMVVIEAHTVDPVVTARYIGMNSVTCMDATHGFSHQYLVEGEVFLNTALAAGYQCRTRKVLAGLPPSHPLLTIQHLVPADVMNSEMRLRAPSES